MAHLYATVPIDFTKQEIRLVKLELVQSSDPIKCILESYSLDDDNLEYVAVSYCWGSKDLHEEIVVNGVPCHVGRNLWWFLDRTRKQVQSINVLLWIDALCINQEEVRERNHQVQLMRHIYSNAHTVWVWLGEAYDDSDLAMDYLQLREYSEIRPLQSAGTLENREIQAVLSLCRREYWGRIWIVQEIILAKQAVIQCGDKTVAWPKLQQLIDILYKVKAATASVSYSAILNSQAAIIVGAKSNWKGPQDLTRLIALYRDQQATDVRDMVYGLHGLASDGHAFVVDYNVDNQGLLLRVLHHALSSETRGKDINRTLKELRQFASMVSVILKVDLPGNDPAHLVNITPAGPSDNNPDDNRRAKPHGSKDDLHSDVVDTHHAQSNIARPHAFPGDRNATTVGGHDSREEINQHRPDRFPYYQLASLSTLAISRLPHQATNLPCRTMSLRSILSQRRGVVSVTFRLGIYYNFISERIVRRFSYTVKKDPSFVRAFDDNHMRLKSTDAVVDIVWSDESDAQLRFHVVENCNLFDIVINYDNSSATLLHS